MEGDNKGIIARIRDMPTTVIEYNPEKFWKENTIESIFKDLQKRDEEEREWKKKTGWKPQYMISVGEAKTANLYHLKWICENYSAIGGSEANKVLKQRQIIIDFN